MTPKRGRRGGLSSLLLAITRKARLWRLKSGLRLSIGTGSSIWLVREDALRNLLLFTASRMSPFSNLHTISLRRPDPKTWPASWLGLSFDSRNTNGWIVFWKDWKEEVSFLSLLTDLLPERRQISLHNLIYDHACFPVGRDTLAVDYPCFPDCWITLLATSITIIEWPVSLMVVNGYWMYSIQS